MFKKTTLILLTVTTLVFSSFILAKAQTVIKYGHMSSLDHPQHLGALAFAKYINEKSKGSMEVRVFPLGQLGGERSLAEQVRAGSLHVATVSSGVLANFVPEFGIIELPFVFPSKEAAYKVLEDKEIMERLAQYCDPKGFVFIGYTENGFGDMTNSKRQIKKPDDLRGLKIRVTVSPIFIDTFKALGANPTSLPLPEVYNALQQKMIDGQDNSLYTSVMMKFTEVNKFATITNHILNECPVVVNSKFWKSLTPDQQKVFREAAEVQITVNRQAITKSGDYAMEKALTQRVDIYTLSVEDRAVFKKAVSPVYDKYKGTFGTAWYDFFLKKIGSYSK
ncbi:MAG: DctP family TRAP transporter solute-binding subunit [Proteobacteria bacterium]|nr:DctP family TRAP transporter solute-binding subunit [Pseudomonadota bacterium]